MFCRVIGEVVDGDVIGSGFSVDVNFQFICIQIPSLKIGIFIDLNYTF
jgi:hypothetical protein